MKTNVIMKIAVVFMAAFGAYAFSGNTNSQDMFTRSDTCENITVGCADDGSFICEIKLSNDQVVPIADLKCEKLIYHTSNNPIVW